LPRFQLGCIAATAVIVLFDGAGRTGLSVDAVEPEAAEACAAAAGMAGSSAIAKAKAAALGTRRAAARCRGRGLVSLAVTCTFQEWVAQARFGAPKHFDTWDQC